MSLSVLISGGAGYIGSHVAYALRQAELEPVVVDTLSSGHAWAASFGAFEQGDVGDADFIRTVCEKYKPVAAMHFAGAECAEASLPDPVRYYEKNRDTTTRFFKTLNTCGVKKVVFASSAAVYGDTSSVYSEAGGNGPVSELYPTRPTTVYGQSVLEIEAYSRMMDAAGLRSVALRLFNVGGAAPLEAQIGEAHAPEAHLIPRLLLPLVDTPADVLSRMGLSKGFAIYGDDYPTRDGTPLRDYIHVLDVAEACKQALQYLMKGGSTDMFNIGTGNGFSVMEVLGAARKVFDKPSYTAGFAPRRAGDAATLVADSTKAARMLGWRASRSLHDIIKDAAAWHRSSWYQDAVRAKVGLGA